MPDTITFRDLINSSAETLAEEVFNDYLEGQGGRMVEERITGATHVLYAFFKHAGGTSDFNTVRSHLDARVSIFFDRMIEARNITNIYINRLKQS